MVWFLFKVMFIHFSSSSLTQMAPHLDGIFWRIKIVIYRLSNEPEI